MTETTPIVWYRRPGVLVGLCVAVLVAGVGIGLFLAAGEDDDRNEVDTVDTTVPTTSLPTTAPPPPTTVVPPPTAPFEDQCGEGDQVACDQLADDQLDVLCEEGNVDACQVLLARQGDGVTDEDENEDGNGNGNGNSNGNGNGNDDDDD